MVSNGLVGCPFMPDLLYKLRLDGIRPRDPWAQGHGSKGPWPPGVRQLAVLFVCLVGENVEKP